MSPLVAIAIRRAGLWGAALTATLLGHALTTGNLHVLPLAPVVWVGMIALSVMLGGVRRLRFAEWGALRILAALVVAQATMHTALHLAPWAFGFVAHHPAPFVTPGAVAAHVLAAALMLLPMRAGQRLLLDALAAVRSLLTLPAPRGPLPRARRVLALRLTAPVAARPQDPRTSRGPPRPQLAPA